jgi:hypothetical protein
MNEKVIVTTFSEDSRAYEALARLKELAADEQATLRDLRERLRHLAHH